MLRGELSNRPAAVYGIDYRVLVSPQHPYEWFLRKVPELLLDKMFERVMRKALPLREGAKMWLENYWDRRWAVISVGEPLLARAIEMVVGDFIAEAYHFDDIPQFKHWVRHFHSLAVVYTNDPALVSLDDIVRVHGGWSER